LCGSRSVLQQRYNVQKKGDYDKAIAEFDIAIQLEPNYTKAHHNRYRTYFEKGDYDNGRKGCKMSETCAVCKKGKGPERCEICGFSDNGVIYRTFPIPEDTQHWLETVVKPYRTQWEARKLEAERKRQEDLLQQQRQQEERQRQQEEQRRQQVVQQRQQEEQRRQQEAQQRQREAQRKREEDSMREQRRIREFARQEQQRIKESAFWVILILIVVPISIIGVICYSIWFDGDKEETKNQKTTNAPIHTAWESKEPEIITNLHNEPKWPIVDSLLASKNEPLHEPTPIQETQQESTVSNDEDTEQQNSNFTEEPSSKENILTDKRDGQTYKIVKIGAQTWMAENLNYYTKDSKCLDNIPDNCSKYGSLYDYTDAIEACPPGWHLPSIKEWGILTVTVGDSSKTGKKLKAKSGWSDGGNGTDSYGFAALPGGEGYYNGTFYDEGYVGYWWSINDDRGNIAAQTMNYNKESVKWTRKLKGLDLFSIRCLKD